MKSILILIAATLLVTACGAQGQGSNGPVEVNVSLKEFAFDSSMTEFQTGVPYRFVVTNNGSIPHEFMIMPPVEDTSGMAMEEMDQMALVLIEQDELAAGASKTVEYTFQEPAPSGTLEFACHVPGHYEAGMRLPITVK